MKWDVRERTVAAAAAILALSTGLAVIWSPGASTPASSPRGLHGEAVAEGSGNREGSHQRRDPHAYGGFTHEALRVFEDRYGVHLRFADPVAGGIDRGGVRAEAVDPGFVPWAVGLAEDFLSAYPEWLIRQNLWEIWFADRIDLHDAPAGGISRCSEGRMAVSINEQRGYDAALRTMHHELAHLLHCNYVFPEDAWLEQCASPYRGDAIQVRAGRDRAGYVTDTLLAEGFVNRYAQTTLREDVAEVAEMLFAEPWTAKQLAERYPRLRAKQRLVRKFYLSIDPHVTFPHAD